MAFPNLHTARIRRPGDFKAGSFRSRKDNSIDGKEYITIMGKLEEDGADRTQAIRYPVADWSEAEAREHAENAIMFEPATGKAEDKKTKKNHVVFQIDYERKAELPSSLFWSIEDSAAEHMIAKVYNMIKGNATQPIEARMDTLLIDSANGVAFIPIKGVLTKDAFFGPGMADLALAVDAAANDSKVDTILLEVDSPGGTIDGLADLGDAVARATQAKTVIAQVDGMVASAAFWIASQATQIFAGRTDLIGSIGVRLFMIDFSIMFKNEGLKAIPIDTGKFKSAGMPGTKITPEQIAHFQEIVDSHFEQFLQAVEQGRGMERAALDKVADGRIFTADIALQAGLIDGVSPMRDTLSTIFADMDKKRSQQANYRLAIAERDEKNKNLAI